MVSFSSRASYDAIPPISPTINNEPPSPHGSVSVQRKWVVYIQRSLTLVGLVTVTVSFLGLFQPFSKQFVSTVNRWGNVETMGLTTSPLVEEISPSSCTSSSADVIKALEPTASVNDVENGAVATDDPRCSEVGVSILRDYGGGAVDAAIAVVLCLQVVNPAGSTLGGGGFMLIHSDPIFDGPKVDFIDKRSPSRIAKARKATNKVTEVIDCREVAPASASPTMFEGLSPDATWNGGLAIAVPGQLKCLELAHARFGKVPWSVVIEPARKMAEEGVIVSSYFAHAINLVSSKKKIFKSPELTKLLTKNHTGTVLLDEGDLFTQPALANTFKLIMDAGSSDVIYKGPIAQTIAADIKKAGGIITAEQDLANYRATLYDPLIARDVGGFTMIGIPPPSSGGSVVLGALRFLAGYKEPLVTFSDTLSQHRMVEATKHAYAVRMWLSDPAYNSAVVKDAVNDLVYTNYMHYLRNLTSDDTVLPLSSYGGSKWSIISDHDVSEEELLMSEEGHDNRRRQRRNLRESRRLEVDEEGETDGNHHDPFQDHGTTHLSIVDKWGNAFSMTTTINTYFGSGVISPSTGIIFNSQMDDFSLPGEKANHYGVAPSESNYIAPGKKPLSSISPTMVFRAGNGYPSELNDNLGKLLLVVGASGGPKIPTAVIQAVTNFVLLGMPLYDAITRPRLHDQLIYEAHSATLYDESPLLQGPTIEISDATMQALASRGHVMVPVSNTGCVQAVAIDQETGKLTAVSDIRKGGKAAGF